MVRPRWHDVLIIVAIVVIGLAGAWALWWDDVREVATQPTASPGPAAPTT